MSSFKKFFEAIRNKFLLMVDDDIKRSKMLFILLNAVISAIAFVMSVINIFTGEYILLIATAAFSVICFGNAVLMHCIKQIKHWLYIVFAFEVLALIVFFFVSGIPNGFSALWVCLIPSFTLTIFGIKNGMVFSLASIVIEMFFFWTPVGRSLLMFEYTNEFLLRFPFLTMACFLIALFIESIRALTQKRLVELENKYKHLYRHDALTGIYNRYGFAERLHNEFDGELNRRCALLILDIDNFKTVNDKYGHPAGDEVLKNIARVIDTTVCTSCSYARWGGEEFIIFMHCEHDYFAMAEKIRVLISEAVTTVGDDNIKVTASIGLAYVDESECVSYAKALKAADKCLYEAKGAGKNCIKSIHVK